MTTFDTQKRTCKEICKRYQVKKPTGGRGRYESGQALCKMCEIWIDHNGCLLKDGSPATMGSVGWTCKCCNFRVRQKPRNLVYKEKLRNKNQHQDEKDNIIEKEEKIVEPKIEENKNISIEIPQANNLQRLMYLVEFISKNIIYPEELAKRLGIDVRQVLYYAQAAQMLDLIEQYKKDSSNFYKITSSGENLLTKRWADRFIVLRKEIKKIPLYEQLLERLKSKGYLQKQEISHFFYTNSELSESTAQRRASTFINWIHVTKMGIQKDDKIFSYEGYRDFKSQSENVLKSKPKENTEEHSTKNIPDENPALTFNKIRGKMLELIKNEDSKYFFMEMENIIEHMSKKEITKLLNEI